MSIKRFSDETGLEIVSDLVELSVQISVDAEPELGDVHENLTWHFKKGEEGRAKQRTESLLEDIRLLIDTYKAEMP